MVPAQPRGRALDTRPRHPCRRGLEPGVHDPAPGSGHQLERRRVLLHEDRQTPPRGAATILGPAGRDGRRLGGLPFGLRLFPASLNRIDLALTDVAWHDPAFPPPPLMRRHLRPDYFEDALSSDNQAATYQIPPFALIWHHRI